MAEKREMRIENIKKASEIIKGGQIEVTDDIDNPSFVLFVKVYDKSVKQNDLIQRYKALLCFEIKNVNAKSLETLRLNPLGIFINNITVSKIITKE